MVRRPVAPHPQPQPRFAIGLGCEIRHATRLIYATGMDLEKTEGTPIGVNWPALRTRKLQPARRAADHADVDFG